MQHPNLVKKYYFQTRKASQPLWQLPYLPQGPQIPSLNQHESTTGIQKHPDQHLNNLEFADNICIEAHIFTDIE